MKYMIIFWLLFGPIFLSASNAQTSKNAGNDSVVAPVPLAITWNKTTNLVFPYAIKSVDRGSKDVLVQKAKGSGNILQLKAARKGLEETNLTVITMDSKLYSYILNYLDTPSILNINVGQGADNITTREPLSGALDEAQMRKDFSVILAKKKSIRGVKDRSYGIQMKLEGIYIHDGIMYFQLRYRNSSSIDYDIDDLRFFIRDQKKARRTATQELDLLPVLVSGECPTIMSGADISVTYALDKFTIPDKKMFSIQMMEKNGGRNVGISVKNRTIMKARPLD